MMIYSFDSTNPHIASAIEKELKSKLFLDNLKKPSVGPHFPPLKKPFQLSLVVNISELVTAALSYVPPSVGHLKITLSPTNFLLKVKEYWDELVETHG